ncbi:MAG TPA: M15 family metallopeptidase [Steroidobacteraceae bacterium]|nr:M15 family metallopeptidase [Steroidobacteraceae bacterium]
MNPLELTGRSRAHIVDLEQPRCSLHYEVVAAFLAMRDAARDSGIDLQAVSSHRDFERQVTLWNRKWRGERPLYRRDGRLLDPAQLTDAERVDAILAWSAIPGGSRHHWGSDIDVIDAAAMPEGYQVQLLPAEYAPDGVFARLSGWLERHMGRFGFFRPYGSDRGGAGIEPWHLSYAPVAREAIEALSLSVLRTAIVHGDMLGKEAVLDRLPEIYTRFILAIDPPVAAERRGTPARA